MLDIDDLRSYVFCIFSGTEKQPGTLDLDSLNFLGTGFFVTKNGDAVTAAHVLPVPDDLDAGRQLYAVLVFDNEEKYCRILMAVDFSQADLAIFRVQTEREANPYFTLSFDDVGNGEDVMAFGVSAHSPYGTEKELRTLKGHITLKHNSGFAELSFPVPAGMSGGPVLIGTRCVGYLTGSINSEHTIDRTEEVVQLTNEREKIEFIEIRQMITYGIFNPFSTLRGQSFEALEGRSLEELITHRNEL